MTWSENGGCSVTSKAHGILSNLFLLLPKKGCKESVIIEKVYKILEQTAKNFNLIKGDDDNKIKYEAINSFISAQDYKKLVETKYFFDLAKQDNPIKKTKSSFFGGLSSPRRKKSSSEVKISTEVDESLQGSNTQRKLSGLSKILSPRRKTSDSETEVFVKEDNKKSNMSQRNVLSPQRSILSPRLHQKSFLTIETSGGNSITRSDLIERICSIMEQQILKKRASMKTALKVIMEDYYEVSKVFGLPNDSEWCPSEELKMIMMDYIREHSKKEYNIEVFECMEKISIYISDYNKRKQIDDENAALVEKTASLKSEIDTKPDMLDLKSKVNSLENLRCQSLELITKYNELSASIRRNWNDIYEQHLQLDARKEINTDDESKKLYIEAYQKSRESGDPSVFKPLITDLKKQLIECLFRSQKKFLDSVEVKNLQEFYQIADEKK